MRVQLCDSITMSSHPSAHPGEYQQQQQQQLVSACKDQELIRLLQSLGYGSNVSVRDAALSGQTKNCVDQILTSFQDAAKHIDGVTGTDLHVSDTGLAVYAFTTPFILIIGNQLIIIARAARVVLFSVVSVCVHVCLSVNAITPEPLGISSQNFQCIIMWSKGRKSSKMAIQRCAGGAQTSPMFYLLDMSFRKSTF